MPSRPTTGSELSWMVFRNMSSSETTGNYRACLSDCRYFRPLLPSASPKTLAFDSGSQSRHFPTPPHFDSGEECVFEASPRFACATTCCLACPLLGADQICIQPSRAFTSGLPTVWSPALSLDITTVPTGQFAPAGLTPARTSTSFTALPRRTPVCAYSDQSQ